MYTELSRDLGKGPHKSLLSLAEVGILIWDVMGGEGTSTGGAGIACVAGGGIVGYPIMLGFRES